MHISFQKKLPIFRSSPSEAFTIVELLIIIVVLGIIGAIVFSAINPSEITKRSRDTIRSTDLQVLNRVLQMHQAEGDTAFGSSNIVYLSLPDSNSACGSYTLPVLPGGWSYSCKPVSTYKNVDSSGWLPVDFTGTSRVSSMTKLPVDPVNSVSGGRYYYSYIAGTGWEINASFESQGSSLGGTGDKSSTDGGDDPTKLEVGTNLVLSPWSFEFSAFPAAANSSGTPGWYKVSGTGVMTVESDATSLNYLHSNGSSWYVWQENIPFNPDSTYKMSCKVRQVTDPTVVGTKMIFCGWTGVAADGVTLVNGAGLNNYGSQHYHAMAGTQLSAGAGWVSYNGYTKGWGSPAGNTGTCSSAASPCKVHQDVRYIRPLFILNYSGGDGIADIDSILFTKQ